MSAEGVSVGRRDETVSESGGVGARDEQCRERERREMEELHWGSA